MIWKLLASYGENDMVGLMSTKAPATPRSMGRRAMDLQQLQVRIAPDDVKRIDALVGNYGRSQFIREAVARELARQERKKEKDDVA